MNLFSLSSLTPISTIVAATSPLLSVPLVNDLTHQRYQISFNLGTPPQRFSLIADTGSTDIWLPLPNSSGCAPNPCPPGSFSPSSSSTVLDTGTSFNVSYGFTPDLQVIGEYYTDTITVGDVTIPNATFANADVPKTLFESNYWGGIFGLGSPYGESLVTNPSSPWFGDWEKRYVPLWQRLAGGRGLYGVWLNWQGAKEGVIDFGGLDEGRFEGELRTAKLNRQAPNGIWFHWQINLTSIDISQSSAGAASGISGLESVLETSRPVADALSLPITLDTGSPNTYLPTAIVSSVTTALELPLTTHRNFSYIPCSYRSTATDISLTFRFASSKSELDDQANPHISVPLPELIYPFGMPENIGEVRDENGTELCYWALIGDDRGINIVGANVIRSAYVAFDSVNQEVRIAKSMWRGWEGTWP